MEHDQRPRYRAEIESVARLRASSDVHSGPAILSLSFSPCGRRLAVGRADHHVYVYAGSLDLRSESRLAPMPRTPVSIAFCEGGHIAALDRAGNVQVSRPGTGEVSLLPITSNQESGCLASTPLCLGGILVSREADLVLVSDAHPAPEVVHTAPRAPIGVWAFPGGGLALMVHDPTPAVTAARGARTVRLSGCAGSGDAAGPGWTLRDVVAQTRECVGFSPCGRFVACLRVGPSSLTTSATTRTQVHVECWDTVSRRLVARAPVREPQLITSVQPSPAGALVLVSYGRRWNRASMLVKGLRLTYSYPVVIIFRIVGDKLVTMRELRWAADGANVAKWSPIPGAGLVLGTEHGELRRYAPMGAPLDPNSAATLIQARIRGSLVRLRQARLEKEEESSDDLFGNLNLFRQTQSQTQRTQLIFE
jgi:hypothetical protein